MLPNYLLDADICIYISKHKPVRVIDKFKRLAVGEVAMSVISFGELYYGAEKSTSAKKAHAALESLIGVIPVLPLQQEAAKYYGRVRAQLASSGNIIGNNDLWIAAHSLALGITLVTNNLREFKRIPKLRVENWLST